MAKKVVALTNIKYGEGEYAVGDEVDTVKFSKEQLAELYDAGAIDVRAVDDEPAKTEEPTKTAQPTPAAKTGPDTTVKAPEKK